LGSCRRLLDQAHDLDGGRRQAAEHEVAGELVRTAHPDHPAGEVVLEAGDDALGGAALLIALALGRAQADQLLAAGFAAEALLTRGSARLRPPRKSPEFNRPKRINQRRATILQAPLLSP
jgi:hypothetical protein